MRIVGSISNVNCSITGRINTNKSRIKLKRDDMFSRIELVPEFMVRSPVKLVRRSKSLGGGWMITGASVSTREDDLELKALGFYFFIQTRLNWRKKIK